jgi:hypothetical protein
MASMPLPEIEKFMPLWVFFAITALAISAFIAIAIVLVITSRRRNED